MPEDFRVAMFDAVWGAVNELYLDPEFNGVDWAAVGEEYAPYFLQVERAGEVYELLAEMVDLLQDPSTVFVAAPLLVPTQTNAPAPGGIGALMDRSAAAAEGEGLRILYVFPGSAAEAAGLASRDRILAVDGQPCVSIDTIRGPVGEPVELLVLSPGERARTVTVVRRELSSFIGPQAKRLEDHPGIGYLRLMSLDGQESIDAIDAAVGTLIEGDQPLEGLILDLRSSTLGASGVVTAVLGHFVEGEVGTLHTRAEEQPLQITATERKPELDDVPMVVLVDEVTEGPAEQLAAILQGQGRATVVGQRTPGHTQGVQQLPLQDGSVLQLVVLGLELPNGSRLEDTGVIPDHEVDQDWLAFPEASDPFLLEALDEMGGTS
jgi:carboxyl-terminal processing protease